MAKEAPKSLKITTPKGIAIYPHLNKPDFGSGKFKKPDGEYSLKLAMPVERGQESMDTLDALVDTKFAEVVTDNGGKTFKIVKGKKKELERNSPYLIELDDDGNPTGNVVFKFSMKAQYTNKKGEVVQQAPKLFDAAGNPTKAAVWGGSELIIAGSIHVYDSEFGIGAKLYLNAAQVIKLVSGGQGGNAESYGFGKQEGYVTDASQEGFKDESGSSDSAVDEDDGSGDF